LTGPRVRVVLLLVLLAWAAIAVWNSIKPMPPGTRVSSLAERLAESQLAVISDSKGQHEILDREIAAIDRAEQMIVLDQVPVAREVGRHLLIAKRRRPSLKIVLVADPLEEVYGGTPAQYLDALEQAGVIVARVPLDRLRDSRPLYSALWRLTVAWWSDPFDERSGEFGLRSSLRRLNFKRDQRQLIVADDGSGGWVSIIPGSAGGDLAVEISGGLARDVVSSELQIAAWSTDDDRIPAAPPPGSRGLGSIDVRFLTEGAIRGALLDAIGASTAGDEVSLAARALSERGLIGAALQAASRGAHLRVLLDPGASPNQAVAAELLQQGGGRIEVRWLRPALATPSTSFAIVRHRSEVWVSVGALDFTRPSLGDFNLEAAVELRLAERAAAARVFDAHFAAQWSTSAPYAQYAKEGQAAYWRYRLLEAAGLAAY
jgi:hypothetical protein